MAVTITKQPQNVQVMKGKITEKLSVTATGATGYQWKKAKSGTSASGATNVAGATSSEMTIPTDLAEGDYFYFCAVSDADSTVNTQIVQVEVVDFPEYMTGAFVNSFLAACDPSIKKRFDEMSARCGITIPNDDVAIRTAQIELFMAAL